MFLFILLLLGPILSLWGSNEINKPFNKWKYRAVYYAKVSDSIDLTNTQEKLINITISKRLFKREIKLNYLYNTPDDTIFSDNSCLLEIDKPIKCKSNDNNMIYYIELTRKIERAEMNTDEECTKLDRLIWGC